MARHKMRQALGHDSRNKAVILNSEKGIKALLDYVGETGRFKRTGRDRQMGDRNGRGRFEAAR